MARVSGGSAARFLFVVVGLVRRLAVGLLLCAALLGALRLLLVLLFGLPGWLLANGLGWVGFWGFTIIAAIPGMLLLWALWRRGFIVSSVRQSEPDLSQSTRGSNDQ